MARVPPLTVGHCCYETSRVRINVIMLYHYKDLFILEQFVHGRLSLQELGFSSKINRNLANVRGKVVRDEYHSCCPYLV